jgi:hypothetical protein
VLRRGPRAWMQRQVIPTLSRPSRIWPVPTLPRAGSTPVRVGPFHWRTFQGMATVFVMKAPTVFLGELTNSELEDWLRNSSTVIIPVGAVEQHGPHSAMLTDVIIPTEIARRVAPRLEALVAPPVSYALSYPHTGFRGVAQIRIPTFMALIEDLCATFA